MTPARRFGCLLTITALASAALGSAALAHAQSATPDTVVYSIGNEAKFEWGCFAPCECPVISRQPVKGTFRLIKTGSDPLFDRYAVADVDWRVADSSVPSRITGRGTYRRGGEVAIQEQLTLELSFDGGRPTRKDQRISALRGTARAGSPRPVSDRGPGRWGRTWLRAPLASLAQRV